MAFGGPWFSLPEKKIKRTCPLKNNVHQRPSLPATLTPKIISQTKYVHTTERDMKVNGQNRENSHKKRTRQNRWETQLSMLVADTSYHKKMLAIVSCRKTCRERCFFVTISNPRNSGENYNALNFHYILWKQSGGRGHFWKHKGLSPPPCPGTGNV